MVDICIIGSGAGAGPIAYELSRAGKKVVVLEKGAFYSEADFSKDEIAYCRRSIITPTLTDEYHIIEADFGEGWVSTPTYESGWDFWNGNIVGGSSNLMSGFFHRMHPKDFKLLSHFGKIDGANVVDWPISYDELEPYYTKVEQIVGISGEANNHVYEPPRSSKQFPFPPTLEHPITKQIDKTAKKSAINIIKTPRAILSQNRKDRTACYYSNYCGSYGCSSGAKGSARAALLTPALKSGNLEIIPNAHVTKLIEKEGKVVKAIYIDKEGSEKSIEATLFVVAAQAIETSRLLLNSTSKAFPKGLGNNSDQVGKNLLFSAGGVVSGEFDPKTIGDTPEVAGRFVNRTIKDWYFLQNQKGGICEALFEHANPIAKANRAKWEGEKLIWGAKLQEKIFAKLNNTIQLNFEIFNDWIPHDDCFVSVDPTYRDKYGLPVAKVRIGSHPQNIQVASKLAEKTKTFLSHMGAKDIQSAISPYPPQNLQAGGCRFGKDPSKSVLDPNCRVHDVENLYITDGSFMPTGGSVPYTWTIYANAFRVADIIKNRFK